MGNANAKPRPKPRNKKQVRWRSAERPSPPGKPSLLQENGLIPDLIHICWQKPEKDGGSPISLYLVEHRRVGSPHWMKSSSFPVTTTELAVNGLEPGWRYQFRIRAENAVGLSDCSEISDPFTVILQRSAIAAPKFTQELKDATVLENSKVELEVHFLGQPLPNICWFKDGFEIFSSNRTRIMTVSDKSILTILQVCIADEGEIKCTGTNKAGHASTKSKLIVEAPPKIRLPKSYQDQDGIIFEIGETITLNVFVEGRPTPLVFWSHNGESIQNDDRHELEYVDKTATLKIENATRTDRGEYQIKAVNKLSQDQASFLVTITNKPTPPGKARVLLTSGRSVTLSWSTPEDDGGCKIGNYIIEYYRLGWNVWLKAATCRQVTTMLGDLIEGSQYKFRVKAESPYGVSDPSEESETIFIPDLRRGINNPKDISRKETQSLEFDRTRRAISSPRVSFSLNDDTPIRPERKKTGKTPEASPRMKRKQLSPLKNLKEVVNWGSDSSIPSRKMTLTFPEKKQQQTSPTIPRKGQSIENSSKESQSLSSSPQKTLTNSEKPTDSMQKIIFQKEKTKSPSPEILITDADRENGKFSMSTSASTTPDRSPTQRRRRLSDSTSFEKKNDLSSNSLKFVQAASEETASIERGENRIRPVLTHQEFSGSSEFMLVLCPEGEQGAQLRKLGIEFEDDSIAPPLSLSAPELGTEPAQQPLLRRSSSSSELLSYNLMERLREADFEEKENKLKKSENINNRVSLDIPTIQVNSKPTRELVGLNQRSPQNRRLSIEVVSKRQPKWSQRRHSLKNTIDMDIIKLHKFPQTEENKRELMEYRQQKELEFQREEESRINKGKMESVDEWLKDYEESIPSEEEEDSSSNEQLNTNIHQQINYDDEEQEETYNPRNRTVKSSKISEDEPFEILTVRKNPPNSSIVPKPILKKNISNNNEIAFSASEKSTFSDLNRKRERSHSLTEYSLPLILPKIDQKEQFHQSNSPIFNEEIKGSEVTKYPNIGIRRSSSLIPSQTRILKETFGKRKEKNKDEVQVKTQMNQPKSVSALANSTSIAGAGMIIPEKMKSNEESVEEAKVVVDFYGDIVKSFGGKSKAIAEFSKTIDSKYSTFEERRISELKPNPKTDIQNETRDHTPNYVNKSIELKEIEDQVSTTNNNYSESSSSNWKGLDFEENKDKTPKNYELKNLSESNIGRSKYTEFRNEGTSVSPMRNRRSIQKADNVSTQMRQFQDKRNKENHQSRSNSVTAKRSPRSRDASTSPVRFEYWEDDLSSRHSVEQYYIRNSSMTSSRSSSLNRRSLSPARPILREITTQTSFRVEPQTPADVLKKQEELATKAEKRMKGVFEYFTDLAMVAVACWFYLFQNEYLAIPILFILVYRQLSEKVKKFRQSMRKYIPKWIMKKFGWQDD